MNAALIADLIREVYALRDRVKAIEGVGGSSGTSAEPAAPTGPVEAPETTEKIRALEGAVARATRSFEDGLSRQTRVSEVAMQAYVTKAIDGLKAEILEVIQDFSAARPQS